MLYDGIFQAYVETLELYIDIEITLIQLYKLLEVEKLNSFVFEYLAYLKDTSVVDNDEYIRLKAIADKELADA